MLPREAGQPEPGFVPGFLMRRAQATLRRISFSRKGAALLAG